MRVLAHAHTTYSRDGTLSPTGLATLAARHGFDAVLVSDHFEHLDADSFSRLVADCEAQSACRLVPGYERSWGGFHVCAFGVRSWMDAADVTSWAAAIRKAGGLLCLAHPARYGFRAPAEILEACDAIEVWNSKRPYDGVLAPHPDATKLLTRQHLALAGQDFHRRMDLSSVSLFLEGDATGRKLIEKLRAGHFSIGSRWLRFERQPPSRLLPSLRAWHGVRPYLWAGPIRLLRWLRRLRRTGA